MLKGIDVSSWNGNPFNGTTESGYNRSDFVIAKATQGFTYVNPACDYAIQRCIADGKLWGFYHYAEGHEPEQEAQFFYDNCKGYIGEGIPALDWEQEQNNAFGDSTWCRRFVDKFHALSGVWPLIYTGRYVIPQVANCASDCGLWLAEWGVSSPGDCSPWETFTIWQWTSNNGSLDENYANLDAESWMKIARGDDAQPEPTPTPAPIEDDPITVIARDVIAGKYGNGKWRKENLYDTVQARVNELLENA